MTLGRIIAIADEAYDKLAGEDYQQRGAVRAYFDNPDGEFGDGLARFIALELKDTYDPDETEEEQILTAFKAMCSFRDQAEEIVAAFSVLL